MVKFIGFIDSKKCYLLNNRKVVFDGMTENVRLWHTIENNNTSIVLWFSTIQETKKALFK